MAKTPLPFVSLITQKTAQAKEFEKENSPNPVKPDATIETLRYAQGDSDASLSF
jgi:hypothetical protein